MEAKFTPGPWKVGPVDETLVATDDGKEVAQICGDYNQPETWPVMEANAHLIAAAPELYEALSDLLFLCSQTAEVCGTQEVKVACAVLAKARGETPET